jgi:hypothetical protein
VSETTPFERRLEQLREQARHGPVNDPGVRPAGAPIPVSEAGYYGWPLLKAPVWTWEVPVYFFVGGAAGASAAIAAVARLAGASPALVRDARWMALGGAALSAPLLISDLGRPERFLYMLRVFKPQSPMSVGVWTLVAFSGAATASVAGGLAERHVSQRRTVTLLGGAADALSAATGLLLATYTGVLIGATAVPVWARNVGLLPVHFGLSGLGAAASALELLGHRQRALRAIGIGVAAGETAIGGYLESRVDPAFDPLHHGRSGHLARMGSLLAGPVPLALGIFAGRSRTARRLAVCSMLAGSLLTRLAWLAAGRESARAPAGTDSAAVPSPSQTSQA